SDVKAQYPEVANKARLRIGRVLIQQKKFAEAEAFFTEIIDSRMEAPDKDVVAGAYLGRGLCTLSKRDATKEDNKQALFDLLRVVVSYKDVGEHQPEALYHAGKCFLLVGDKDAARRSQALFSRLKTDWPASIWAQKAIKELGG
ncbi:MAG: tetratricopeptide repeat protein, partial [Planctomycetota bacterium]